MKIKLILCLALVLSGGLFSCSTDSIQSRVSEKNWVDAEITLYRTIGRTIKLHAKQTVFFEKVGTDSIPWNVIAFVDPETGKAWVGEMGGGPNFFLETKSNIVCGNVLFMTTALNRAGGGEMVIDGAAADGFVNWHQSYVPAVKRGDVIQTVIERFNRDFSSQSQRIAFDIKNYKATTFPISKQGKKGLNPWLFLPQLTNTMTTVESIDVHEGKLRLNLKGPDGLHAMGTSGIHTASVWIDLQTWEVVKVIQDSQS